MSNTGHIQANLLQTHLPQCFNEVQGSNKIPRQIAVGSKASPHVFGLYGTKVLAEIPQLPKEVLTCLSQMCVANVDDNNDPNAKNNYIIHFV